MKSYLICSLLFFAHAVLGQQKVSGTVIDLGDSSPLPGVNILVEGEEHLGTMTDIDGTFSMIVPEDAKTVTFKYIGYKQKSVNVEECKEAIVSLSVSATQLDEIFVIGIAELCELLNISRAQFHRKLKKLTGLSHSHYIRSLRLEIAKELLVTTNLNISEVAFKVGFSSATYFSKVFKSQYGHAPSDHQ
jgi:AraC-like DNA-binding protein